MNVVRPHHSGSNIPGGEARRAEGRSPWLLAVPGAKRLGLFGSKDPPGVLQDNTGIWGNTGIQEYRNTGIQEGLCKSLFYKDLSGVEITGCLQNVKGMQTSCHIMIKNRGVFKCFITKCLQRACFLVTIYVYLVI